MPKIIDDQIIYDLSTNDDNVKKLKELNATYSDKRRVCAGLDYRRECILHELLNVNNDALQFSNIRKHYDELNNELGTINEKLERAKLEVESAATDCTAFHEELLKMDYTFSWSPIVRETIWYSKTKLEEYMDSLDVPEEILPPRDVECAVEPMQDTRKKWYQIWK